MKKSAISALLLALLAMGLCASTLEIRLVKAEQCVDSLASGSARSRTRTVGTSVTLNAISKPCRRELVFAADRFWIFYSDGSHVNYVTSADGLSWTNPTIVRADHPSNTYFSVWNNGTDFIYIWLTYSQYEFCVARRGTFASNGTITWTQSEQAINNFGDNTEASIAQDTSGRFWYAIGFDGSSPWVVYDRSIDTTPHWNPTGWRYLWSTNYATPLILPLPNNDMYIIASQTNGLIRGALYNSNEQTIENWQPPVVIGHISTGRVFGGFSAISHGNNIYLTYLDDANNVVYQNYSYGVWNSPIIVQPNVKNDSYPTLTLDEPKGSLYVFWSGSPKANHVYYKKIMTNGTVDASPTAWLTGTKLVDNERLTSFYRASSDNMGVVFLRRGKDSSYQVRFAGLSVSSSSAGASVTFESASDMDDLSNINVLFDAFGSMSRRVNWNLACDIDCNGRIDMGDINAVLDNYGKQ